MSNNKAKLIILSGLPASGKSTIAKQMREADTTGNTVIVERDLIRDQLGVSRTEFDEPGEKRVKVCRNTLITQHLKDGKTVISSDTNLYSTKALENIAAQHNAEVEHIRLDVPVEECIRRDSLRTHSVGKEVIYRMYARIRPDLEVRQEKAFIIGDIHGDIDRFKEMLWRIHIRDNAPWGGMNPNTPRYVNPLGYKVILLGDLNDPRLDSPKDNRDLMSSVACIRLAKHLNELGFLEVVQSNHHKNIIDLYYGKRKKLSHGLNYTKEEFDALDPKEASSLINWLESLPYYYSFRSLEDKLYVCSHAYYAKNNGRQFLPNNYSGIYGPLTPNRDRLDWWLDDSYLSDEYIQVVGHYHKSGFFPSRENPKAILLDAECGNTGGKLMGYDVDEDKVYLI